MTKSDFWQILRGYFNRDLARDLGSFFKKNWVLGSLITISLIAILAADLEPRQVNLQVGQVAPRDIQAPRTIIDKAGTEELRKKAEEQAEKLTREDPANYVINREIAQEAGDQLDQVFQLLSETVINLEQLAETGDITQLKARETKLLEDAADQIYDITEVRISASSLVQLRDHSQSLPTLESTAESLLNTYLLSERLTPENLEGAREEIRKEFIDRLNGLAPAEPVASIVAGLLKPNLVLDPEAVQRAREIARQSVEPIRILKGQAIVRRGDVIDQEDLRILRELGLQREGGGWTTLLGVIILTGILVSLLGVYIYQNEPKALKDESMLALLGLVLVTMAFAAKIMSTIPWPGIGYVIPVAFATMLIAILVDSVLAVITAIILSILVGTVTGGDYRFVLVALVGGLTAIFSVSEVSQRSDLMRAGGIIAGVTFFTILGLGLFQNDLSVIKQSYLGLVNGIVSSILAIGSLAYLESLFGITSSIKLLELANPNQPLIKRLLVEAPGTYHHSLMVANLAEAAAEAIGGDPLLARVGAYYHDIGKLKRPYFFVENQFSQENPHDKISPSLSTLIITSHVKDGVELAREAKLPQVIIDIIQQHHGTDLVKYFYHRAQENEKDGSVSERDFRYSGPRPQTKEAALVMLADSTEAAVRSMQKPTPGRLEAMVRKIIKERLDDGQLNESDLTLKDLDAIANNFVRVLSGIFHARVEYPDKLIKEMEAKKNK
ncbi:MAG: HDIG domain-containing protein [Firmicutes bacterium]|nr:HDIG domain-containing protein [Bacillota bacterium]